MEVKHQREGVEIRLGDVAGVRRAGEIGVVQPADGNLLDREPGRRRFGHERLLRLPASMLPGVVADEGQLGHEVQAHTATDQRRAGQPAKINFK